MKRESKVPIDADIDGGRNKNVYGKARTRVGLDSE